MGVDEFLCEEHDDALRHVAVLKKGASLHACARIAALCPVVVRCRRLLQRQLSHSS
jgi:hypothetical protein